jgi:hypothetical protein
MRRRYYLRFQPAYKADQLPVRNVDQGRAVILFGVRFLIEADSATNPVSFARRFMRLRRARWR